MPELIYPWYPLVMLKMADADNCPAGHGGWHMVSSSGGVTGFSTACGHDCPADFAQGERAATREAIQSGEVKVCPDCLAHTDAIEDPRQPPRGSISITQAAKRYQRESAEV